MNFSVVVPTRNRPEMVVELVAYLRRRLRWTCPLILIDQSDDEGAGIAALLARESFEGVTHHVQTERGTSVARNEGMRRAASSWVIFLDDDVRPIENYLEQLRCFIAENPWLDAVQGAVEYGWEEYREDSRTWAAQRSTRPNRPTPQRHWGAVEWFLRTPKSAYPCMVLGLGSGNLAVSREAFFSVGGFDENCEGLGEDIELGLRFWWYGYRVCLCPDAIAFHLRAAFGGTRIRRSRWKTLLQPDPPPSLLYLQLKWFRGRPFWEMMADQFGKWMRRPWGIPFKAIRLVRSINIAKARLARGPRYLAEPRERRPGSRTSAMSASSTEVFSQMGEMR